MIHRDIPEGTVTVFQIARELDLGGHAVCAMLIRAGIHPVGKSSVRGWGACPWMLYPEADVAAVLSEREEKRARQREARWRP